jgi:hypothetical protein
MSSVAWKRAAVVAFAIAIGSGIGAVAAAEDSGEARLYTNADLDRLGPAPREPSEPIRQGDAGGPSVQEFLANEYARLDAQRAAELRRAALELEAERRDSPAASGFLGSPFLEVFGRRGFRHSRHGASGIGDVRGARTKALGSVGAKSPHRKADRIRLRTLRARRP